MIRPKQFSSDTGPSMTGDEEARPVDIHRGRAASTNVRCSCCHGPATDGVFAHTRRDEAFDAVAHAHVFICLACASRFGAEAARVLR